MMLVHNTKQIHLCILCEQVYKTTDTLARHTKSEEHSKVKTLLELEMYLQKVKPNGKAEM